MRVWKTHHLGNSLFGLYIIYDINHHFDDIAFSSRKAMKSLYKIEPFVYEFDLYTNSTYRYRSPHKNVKKSSTKSSRYRKGEPWMIGQHAPVGGHVTTISSSLSMRLYFTS